MQRGTFGFAVTPDGILVNDPANVAALGRLWLDRTTISGADLGPGNPGDFDHGAWHVACHVVAAGGVRRAADGSLRWLEISHRRPDEYYASVTAQHDGRAVTHPLDSAAGAALLAGSSLLGFVEGTSEGHVSARGIIDRADRFNGWMRQDFDRSVNDRQEGGKVWEHWCTVRDLRPRDALATSVLRAYVALMAALGDRFAPTVARGRREYGHPTQLCAMVRAGLTAEGSATWDTTPNAVPPAVERLLLQARPTDALAAVEQLPWATPPLYYMFARRIAKWSPATAVQRDLRDFGR